MLPLSCVGCSSRPGGADFDKLAWSLVLSLACWVLSVGVVFVVLRGRPGWQTHTSVSLANWWFAVVLFLFALLLGYLTACFVSRKWLPWRGVARSPYPTVRSDLGQRDQRSLGESHIERWERCLWCGKGVHRRSQRVRAEMWLYPIAPPLTTVITPRRCLAGAISVPANQIAFVEVYHYEDATGEQRPTAPAAAKKRPWGSECRPVLPGWGRIPPLRVPRVPFCACHFSRPRTLARAVASSRPPVRRG